MGFFSWNCKKCGHPMLSEYAISEKNGWMNKVVVILPGGSILKGSYDGYGRVDGREIDGYEWTDDDEMTNSPQCYHEACWKAEGKPSEYTEGSNDSEDQGYFFDDGTHDIDPPS